MLENCLAVEETRRQEGIRAFFDECSSLGLSSSTAYQYYISGLDVKGGAISLRDHLSRGGSLLRLTEAWLNIWDPSE